MTLAQFPVSGFSRLTHHILYRLFVVWKCPPVLHVYAIYYLGQLWNKFDLWISGHNFLCTQHTFHWKYLQCDSYRWSPGAFNEFKKIWNCLFFMQVIWWTGPCHRYKNVYHGHSDLLQWPNSARKCSLHRVSKPSYHRAFWRTGMEPFWKTKKRVHKWEIIYT